MTTNLASILRQSAGIAEITLLAALLMVVKSPPAHRMEPRVLEVRSGMDAITSSSAQ